MKKIPINRKSVSGKVMTKLQDDAELKRVAMWLATVDPDDLDDLRKPVQYFIKQKKSQSEIAQALFAKHKKELKDIRDFNEQFGVFFPCINHKNG